MPSSAAPPKQVNWIRERIARGIDPLAGATVWQLTSGAMITHAIYGEQLYCSADGTRIALLRCYSTDYKDGPMELWVADLNNESVTLLGPAAFFLVAGNGEQDSIYYLRRNGSDAPTIVRVTLKTLEQTEVFAFGKCPVPESRGLLAVSPDGRYCMIIRRLGERRFGIERIDLKSGTWQLIHEKDDIFNAHLQFSPAGGDVMVQQNRGGLLDEARNVVRSVGPEGATLYVIDQDGKNERALPIGKPHTPPVTGHECWLGKTGRVLLTTERGRIITAAPGDAEATLIADGRAYIHISASPDGRFFVADDIKTSRLYLGCIATKRVLPFCDTGASSGSPQYTHTHPYITPGNHRVIFNSDRTGICQAYAASIPKELLEMLEAGDALKK
ncbi:MAG: hypothetical protein ABMA13_18550 [Chthoniobacteraceae bacterium]